ncbi:hypothetical protein ACIHIX_25865 [Streptomyces sp. NPDC051913]
MGRRLPVLVLSVVASVREVCARVVEFAATLAGRLPGAPVS